MAKAARSPDKKRKSPIKKSGSRAAGKGRKAAAARASSSTKRSASAATPRRKTAAPSRGKTAAPSRRKTARQQTSRKPARAPQKFVASHLHTTSFAEGLRAYAQYRDLGINDATSGLVQAHVIRFVPPCRPEEVSKLHYHDVDFQLVYVLKGWIRSEFAGEGAHTFEAGACWIQPPRIEHRVLDYSDDCEVLEIVMPADFDTVTLD